MRVALSGKMGSGKSTVLEELAKVFSYKGISIGGEIKPLAASLIEDRKTFEARVKRIIPNKKQRESSIKEIYYFFDENFRNAHWEKDESGVFVKNPPYRKLLQDFPMLIRNHFGEEVFAKLMIERLNESNTVSIVCDDLRLPNEKTLLERHGFLIIRLDITEEEQRRRLKEKYGIYDESILNHRTEMALDNANFDLRIDVTDKCVSEIAERIESYLKHIKGVRV